MEKYLITDFTNCPFSDVKYGREPVVAVMPNSELVCVMVTGGPTEPHNDNVVVMCRSCDNGQSWSAPELLFHHKNRGVWATEIYTGFSKPMIVLYTYAGECPYKELQTFVSYSADNGLSWTLPKSIAPFANGMCLRKGIKMSNGETLFPVYYTDLFGTFDLFLPFGDPCFWKGTRHSCGVVVTSDEGRHYTPYGTIQLEPEQVLKEIDYPNHAGSPHLWEPNCVEVEPGHIIMYMRDSHYCYINMAESFDYGKTWQHTGNLDIPNADSKIAMEKIGNTIIMVSNAVNGFAFSERKNLQIKTSVDGCKTWKPVAYVSQKEELLFYPHIAVDNNNGLVYIAYENGVQHYINRYTFDELGINI